MKIMFLTDFFGRLHPLLVHLPIGILLFAFALILFQRFQKVEVEVAISFALLLGSISAVFASAAGWFLAQSGEYDADLVFQHQWMGMGTAVFSFAAYFIKRIRDILTTITVCALMVTGHFGGNLTHGEDYLFPKKKSVPLQMMPTTDSVQQEVLKVSPAELATANLKSSVQIQPNTEKAQRVKTSFIFRDAVLPILEKKCFSCHSATKKKGGLRLDTEEFILLGGKNGAILTAGNPENSTIYLYMLLPEDDDNHMPPKGKPQLTPQEIAIFQQWIKQGASFQEEMKVFLEQQEEKKEVIENKSVNFSAPKTSVTPSFVQDVEGNILKNKMEAVPPSLLNQLKQQNIIVSNFGTNSNYLMVNFVNVKDYRSALIDDVLKLGDKVVRLRLSQQPVSDSDIKKLSALKNITRLNLEKTAITDLALNDIKNLPNLEQINLYGTNITDNGLLELANCAHLKVVFLWQTKTTAKGIEQLKRSLPNVQVELGGVQFAKPDTAKTKNLD
jgi:uncharacterized membrane protein